MEWDYDGIQDCTWQCLMAGSSRVSLLDSTELAAMFRVHRLERGKLCRVYDKYQQCLSVGILCKDWSPYKLQMKLQKMQQQQGTIIQGYPSSVIDESHTNPRYPSAMDHIYMFYHLMTHFLDSLLSLGVSFYSISLDITSPAIIPDNSTQY